jgi:hypothetical protein
MTTRHYIFSKTVVVLISFVILFSFGFDYFLNLKTPHALYENALFILSFLACTLFVLMGCGLYFGLKLKDNIGKLTDHIDIKKLPDFSGGTPDVSELIENMGGIVEGLGGFLFAILAAIILIVFGWAIVLVSWYLIIFLAAILYWIFFRAIRLVLKYSMQCKGNVLLSLQYSLVYTFLYSSWMYGIIFTLHYIQH